jgi:5-oxoprolinase (ATP-hydrolysing) subunit A
MDLNADLGEGFGIWRLTDDEGLLGVVSSANVACGFHAGDPLGLRRVVAAAAAAGVAVGAQVSYRDLVGFGRRFLDVAPDELCAEIVYQAGALDALCRVEGTSVTYLKPHGALYAACLTHPAQGAAVQEAAAALGLPVLHGQLPGAVVEAFADRAYLPTGALVPRGEPGAVLHDAQAVVAQAVRLATEGTVVAVDGSTLSLSPASLCLHGDTPGAVGLARQVRAALEAAGVIVQRFT